MAEGVVRTRPLSEVTGQSEASGAQGLCRVWADGLFATAYGLLFGLALTLLLFVTGAAA